MKALLRALLGWLERKFPDRVEVTMAEYLTLKAQLDTTGKLLKTYDEWAAKTGERLNKIEAAINNINVQAGIGALANDKFKIAPYMR